MNKSGKAVGIGMAALSLMCSTSAFAQAVRRTRPRRPNPRPPTRTSSSPAAPAPASAPSSTPAMRSPRSSNDALRSRAASSVTETLKSVPGFWVEASGGEGSGNVRARGIPVDGFGSINLLEDGLPVQHDPALGYLNADQAFRMDESIDRVEVVRGGPSSVFEPNAPGGVVNFITQAAGRQPVGQSPGSCTARPPISSASTAGSARRSATAGSSTSAASIATRQGVRDPGYTGNKGGQIRADLSRDFDNGHVSFSYKRLADNAIFYTGIPLTKDSHGNIVGIAGFDPNYGTTASRATAFLTLRSADGPVSFNNTDGTRIRLESIFGDGGLGVRRRLDAFEQGALSRFEHRPQRRLSRVDQYRARAMSLQPGAIAARRLSRARPACSCATPIPASRSTSPNQNGNGADLPERRAAGDGRRERVPRRPAPGPQVRSVRRRRMTSRSASISRISTRPSSRYSATTLQDVSDNSRLLDLVALNAAGQVVGALTQNGVSRYGSEFANGSGSQDTIAVYASDEWQMTPQAPASTAASAMSKSTTKGSQEGHHDGQSRRPDDVRRQCRAHRKRRLQPVRQELRPCRLHDRRRLAVQPFGGGLRPLHLRLPPAERGQLHHQCHRDTASRRASACGKRVSRLRPPLFSVYATGFLTDFDSYAICNFTFVSGSGSDSGGFIIADRLYRHARLWRRARGHDAGRSNGSTSRSTRRCRKPTFRDLRFNEVVATPTGSTLVARDYSGNQLLRVPKLALRATPAVKLLDDRFRAQMDVEHYSERFADAANISKLPAYTVFNASVRFDLTDADHALGLWRQSDQRDRPDRGQSPRRRADQRPGQ